ncbi:hypothetical protein ACXPWS_19000 [Mycobacterium sp. BMJ-28]
MSDANPTDQRLDSIKRKIEATPETVFTIQGPLVAGTSQLTDEDIEVVTIKVRVPSSALLENISISRRSANTEQDNYGPVLGNNEGPDHLHRKDVTDTI